MHPAFAVLLAVVIGGLWVWWRTSTGGGRNEGRAIDAAWQAFTGTSYFRGLDGLRALSVIAVIWHHVTGPHEIGFLNHGNRGVDLFFAISGFLVTTLLLRERRATGGISLRDFYIRRTLRIFPLYYAVLALYAVLVFATMRGTPKGSEFWQHLPAFATYTSNWFLDFDRADSGIVFYFAWSLATEEQFYLFWPPLLAALLARGRLAWFAAIVAVALVALRLLASEGVAGTGFGVTLLASLAPPILFGAALALLLDHRPTFAVLAPVLGHPFAPPAIAMAALLLLELRAPGIVTAVPFALLVASICLRQDSVLQPLLQARPVVFIGTVSYGVYLMHMLAANAVRKVVGQQGGALVFVGTLALVLAMAAISHRWFERPILRRKTRFTRGARVGAPAGALAAAFEPVVPEAGARTSGA